MTKRVEKENTEREATIDKLPVIDNGGAFMEREKIELQTRPRGALSPQCVSEAATRPLPILESGQQ